MRCDSSDDHLGGDDRCDGGYHHSVDSQLHSFRFGLNQLPSDHHAIL